MNTKNKFYLCIGLLLSAGNFISLYADTPVPCEYPVPADEPKDYDVALHKIFTTQFFNEKDTSTFCQLIEAIIIQLQKKRHELVGTIQQQCDQFIVALQKSKKSASIPTWQEILNTYKYDQFLPEKTREYINSLSEFYKIKVLIIKIKNNK